MINIKYILHPAQVRSMSDGQYHFITANRLAELYGVNRNECVVRPSYPTTQVNDDEFRCYQRKVEEFDKKYDNQGLINLYVRNNGDYRLPTI